MTRGKPPTKSPYTEHLVAFLDVLGFRALVKGNKKEKIDEYFLVTKVVEKYLRNIQIKSNIKFITFSDSIVMGLDVDGIPKGDRADRLRQFCIAVSILQCDLAKHGIWIRGGISFGDLSFEKEKNVIFGPALIDAYDLEAKVAKVPRVLVSQIFLKYLDCETTAEIIAALNTKIHDNWSSSVLYSWRIGEAEYNSFKRDYPLFVDYLGQFLIAEKHEELGELIKLLQITSNETPEAYEKLRWVGDYLIASYRTSKNNIGPSIDALDPTINALEKY